ncbi:flavodoxin-like quinone reductase 1, partial [Perilla frutescens var. hirtella]
SLEESCICLVSREASPQATRILTAITQLAHHGMIFVPLGYTFGGGMFEMEEVRGGSAYGAGTYAADGSRQPTELELQQAFHQGSHILCKELGMWSIHIS